MNRTGMRSTVSKPTLLLAASRAACATAPQFRHDALRASAAFASAPAAADAAPGDPRPAPSPAAQRWPNPALLHTGSHDPADVWTFAARPSGLRLLSAPDR
jgi:hypothetical protein